MICEHCGKEHDGSFGSGRFCSRSCANSRKHSKETKNKISKTLLKRNNKRKYCEKCGKVLSRNNKGSFCRNCKPKVNSFDEKDYRNIIKHRKKRKELLVEYKGGKCQICGYDKCLRALVFHHINPDEKKFSISSKVRNKEDMFKEVDKCIIVCANCHAEIHEGLVNIEDYMGL